MSSRCDFFFKNLQKFISSFSNAALIIALKFNSGKEGEKSSENQIMHHNYFNCAAPKAKIAQNIVFMRQVHSELPSYPTNVRVPEDDSPVHRPAGLNVKKKSSNTTNVETPRKISGILKNYKSCPVSPVHEELDWTTSSNQANPVKLNVANPKHRHTMYYGDAQTIIDKIQNDTEKMIAEITEKYGDLNEFEVTDDSAEKNKKVKTEKSEHHFLSDEDANFSSDSLEECSLDFDLDLKEQKPKQKQCKKHAKKYHKTPPRSVSEYFIYDDFYNNLERKVSLADILNDDRNDIANERQFLETQRHSSASFFLSHPDRKSQDSILSDDYDAADPVSFTNSMESILSDESECKSAPLEALFERGKMIHKNIGKVDRFENVNSKSYGSSPNSSSFDYYMQQRYHENTACDLKSYNFDDLEQKSFKVISEGPIHSPTRKKFSTTLSFSTIDYEKDMNFEIDYIPSSSAKTAIYDSRLKKSLSKDFASQRRFQHEQTFQPNQQEYFSECNSSSTKIVMKKSCSFEIDMGNGQKRYVRTNKFEQNLRRFEKERKDQEEEELKMQKSDYNLEMGFVAHKPPVAHRRTSSMKNKHKSKLKMHYNTISTSQTMGSLKEIRDFVNEDYLHKIDSDGREQTFEFRVKEKSNFDNDDLNFFEDSYDSKNLDFDFLELPPLPVNAPEQKQKKCLLSSNEGKLGFSISPTHLIRFRDIEKKIDVINKLVALEERKLQEERNRQEFRVKPLFDGNTKERGFVKYLTKNFDKLAENGYEDISNVDCIRRNQSLPDVLEGAKFQFNTVVKDIQTINTFKADKNESDRGINMKIFDFDEDYGEGVKIGITYNIFVSKILDVHISLIRSYRRFSFKQLLELRRLY